MALISQVNSSCGTIDNQDTTIPLEVTVGVYSGATAIRIGSDGSAARQTQPKPSQVYVLDEKSARQLYDIMKTTFNF